MTPGDVAPEADDMAMRAAVLFAEQGWSDEIVAAFAASFAALTDQLIACEPLVRHYAKERTMDVMRALVQFAAVSWHSELTSETLPKRPS